jgi:hypothetical protein
VFTIDQTQMTALRAAALRKSEERLAEYLRQRFPGVYGNTSQADLLRFVHDGRTKAATYGLNRLDNLATFLDLMVMYPGFPNVEWASDVLHCGSLHGPDKIALLKDIVGDSVR